jgi:hypothetical protein
MKSTLPILSVVLLAVLAWLFHSAPPSAGSPPQKEKPTLTLEKRASLHLARESPMCGCSFNDALARAILTDSESSPSSTPEPTK